MAGGTLKIRFDRSVEDQDHEIYIGSVTSISNTVQKRGSAYPVVTQGVQNSFPIENGNSQSYTFNFTHHNGQNGQTNAEWMADMESAIDRWQARTDGCKLIYTHQSGNVYIEDMVLEGYIKSLNTTYKNDYNEIITGTLSFTVGRMYINEGEVPSGTENYQNMFIMMSDASQTNWYMIYSGEGTDKFACVDSVKIIAGPESPFEYAIIEMSRKKLMEQIPALMESQAIVDNRNKIFMNVLGLHDMFVQECSSSGDIIKITAYCNAQAYRSNVLASTYIGKPDAVLKQILMTDTLGTSFAESNIKMRYVQNDDLEEIMMPQGTSVYRALQICAKLLKARLFFADNCAWVIDYTMDPSYTPSGMYAIFNPGDIILRGGQKLNGMSMGESTCDDQGGFEPVKNHCTIRYTLTDDNGNQKTYDEGVDDEGELSVGKFDTLNYGTIVLPELSAEMARVFARNHLAYLREPQRAMKFTLKENYGDVGKLEKSWKSYFSPCAVVMSLEDDYNSEKVDNWSILQNNVRAYHKLALSQYIRSFPQGTCEYTFGLIASVELSDNLSQTNTSLNS